MIGKESIDLSLRNIWRSWFAFRKGKRATDELHTFQYFLERNLNELFQDLNNGRYRHGGYRKFVVCDNKRREISVASIRDRIVHRLMYDYLEKIYDKTFIYDAWSCRKGSVMSGSFLTALKLQVNPKSDKIMKVSDGLQFLGVKLWSSGRTLNRRNLARVNERLKKNNISSYSGLIMKHGNTKQVKRFNWLVCEKILDDK